MPIAALRAVWAQRPAQLIAAMAVVSPGALTQIGVEADEVVCLEAPDSFNAVAQFFEDVSQVTDSEVVTTLLQSASKRPRGA
jgi:predicted phosphoribosyltransferase